jgi:hypothetical protein
MAEVKFFKRAFFDGPCKAASGQVCLAGGSSGKFPRTLAERPTEPGTFKPDMLGSKYEQLFWFLIGRGRNNIYSDPAFCSSALAPT